MRYLIIRLERQADKFTKKQAAPDSPDMSQYTTGPGSDDAHRYGKLRASAERRLMKKCESMLAVGMALNC